MARKVPQRPLRRVSGLPGLDKVAAKAIQHLEQKLEEADDRLADNERLPGSLIRVVTFTADGIYTPHRDARTLHLRMVGGGGGGGGAESGANYGVGGGGASGMYLETWLVLGQRATGGAVAVGAAGTGGSGAAAGANGGTTSVVINGRTYAAAGGTGGLYMANGSDTRQTGSVVQQGGSSSGDGIILAGCPGFDGHRASTPSLSGGNGGTSPLGVAGWGSKSTLGNAGSAAGFGAGGGGAVSGATTRDGGSGSPGIVIIEEYR